MAATSERFREYHDLIEDSENVQRQATYDEQMRDATEGPTTGQTNANSRRAEMRTVHDLSTEGARREREAYRQLEDASREAATQLRRLLKGATRTLSWDRDADV